MCQFRKSFENCTTLPGPIMASPTLVTILQALQAFEECTQEHLYQRIKAHAPEGQTFALSTFNNYVHGRHKHPRKVDQIAAAVGAYAASKEYDLNLVVARHTLAAPARPAIRTLPDQLRGGWYLVQYRGKRFAQTDPIANNDYRVAVLVYGADKEKGREFQVIGLSTSWEGRVSLHPQEPVLYYVAEEKQRSHIKEWFRMLMHVPFLTDSELGYHHGILLGVGRGPHDFPNPPIYASRALLSPIDSEAGRKLRAPLQPAEITKLKKCCAYFPHHEDGNASAGDDSDHLIAERVKAIKAFKDRGPDVAQNQGNFGERIFVRI
jgi:hypothetical protein